jgi:DNA-binding CsgD family transcriptional regulator
MASCADLAARGRAQVVWIEGENGAGKTALVRRAARDLDGRFVLQWVAGDEQAQDVSYSTLAQLGGTSATSQFASSPFAAGLNLLERLATMQSDGPVGVIVEDVHWADPASRAALLTVARRLRDDSVLLVLTSRPDVTDDDWARFTSETEYCARLTMGGFDDDDVAALARAAGVVMSTSQSARLRRHTLGHPLHVRTLLHELTPAQLTSPDELPAPRSLAIVVTTALGGLPAGSRTLAEALAVLGRPTALSTVAHVAGVATPSDALEPLLRTGFVTWHPSADQSPVEFAHPLYRAAVYDDLPAPRRRELHLACAAVTRWGPSWAHRTAAADGPDDALADELIAGSDYEVGRSDLSLAATYLSWAARLASSSERAEELLLRSARLLIHDGQTARAAELYPRLIASSPTALRDLVLGMLAFARADPLTAERYLRDVAEVDPVTDATREHRAEALGQLALLCTLRGRADDAVAAARGALALGPLEDPRTDRNAWWALSVGEAMARGGPRGLDLLLDRLAQPAADVPSDDAELLVARGLLRLCSGATADAVDDLRAALDLARSGVGFQQLPRAHLTLARALFMAGEWDESLVQARTASSLIDDSRPWLSTQAEAALALVHSGRGDWDVANRLVEALTDATLGTVETEIASRSAIAALGHARDDPDAVIATLEPLAGDAAVTGAAPLTMLAWWPMLVAALIGRGDLQLARTRLAGLAETADACGLHIDVHLADLQGRLALAEGDPDSAAASFERALDALSPDHPALERALLLQQFGRLLRTRGQRRRGEDLLRQAHGQLDRLGAAPYLARVEADLHDGGSAARTKRTQQPFALTAREMDVAVLVKRGLTNKEVAKALYVSSKAVEYHLGKVFGKRSISSRRELRDLEL